MQYFITVLNKEYQKYQYDPAVEHEKGKHLEDCH